MPKQLAAWWNDGAVMAHAGFPNGLGTTEEEIIERFGNGCMVIEESDRLIGECNYRNIADGVAEIGIKICETDCQNRGVGRKVLSMLIGWLFRNGYSKIVLDTNLTNTRAQHVYESLGFRKVRTNIDSWKDQLGQLQSSVDYELVKRILSVMSEETPMPDNRNRKRPIQVKFFVDEKEQALIKKKMEHAGIENMSVYIRKMVIDGYVVKLDMPELRELTLRMKSISNSENQIAKRVNSTGNIYETDIEEIKKNQEEIYEGIRKILTSLSKIE